MNSVETASKLAAIREARREETRLRKTGCRTGACVCLEWREAKKKLDDLLDALAEEP